MSDEKEAAPGWYESESGGLRYFNGSAWTEHRAPAPPAVQLLHPTQIAWGVFQGVFGALALVWFLAQVAPDVFYLPVKFVVGELP
jgi:hypothetical protein